MKPLTLEQWLERERANPNRRPDTQDPIGVSTTSRRNTDARCSQLVAPTHRDRKENTVDITVKIRSEQ